MVRVKKESKEADAVTSKLFLTSINSWYKKKGIKVGVEKVSNLYPNKNDKKKRGIAVTLSVLDEMPKCRAREIEEGKVVMVEDDETGEEKPKIIQIEDPDEVTFFFNVRIEDEEKNEFSVNPKASCFPLFNPINGIVDAFSITRAINCAFVIIPSTGLYIVTPPVVLLDRATCQ